MTLPNIELGGKGPHAARVIAAFRRYDGDACRPEHNVHPKWIAREVLHVHSDLVRCYCPLCVLAREVLS